MAALDTTEREIVQNVVEVLENLTADGEKVFASVALVDHPESFVKLANTQGKRIAAVVVRPSQRRPGGDNGEAYVKRLAIDVVMQFPTKPLPGQIDQEAVSGIVEFSELVRDALLEDPSRGGRAGVVKWGGEIIAGTSVYGDPGTPTKMWKEGEPAVVLPVAVGIVKNRE